MALDTTTGAATAESYCTVAFATSYFEDRSIAAWELLDDEVMEGSLRKATEYLDMTFQAHWLGARVDSTQILDWPRYGIYANGYAVSSTTIPIPIQRACAEMALKASSEDITADLSRGVLEKTIGPLKTVYDPNSPQAKRYPSITKIMAQYISTQSSVSVGLVRT